jgi:hypothetical protein
MLSFYYVEKWAQQFFCNHEIEFNFLILTSPSNFHKPKHMKGTVYNVIPLLLEDGSNQHHFQLKLSESTQSFRLEGTTFRRSIFIGRRAFNRLFRLLRNEYGFILGKIFYEDGKMRKGTATTSDNHHYHFTVDATQQLKVILQEDNLPAHCLTATIPITNEELNRLDAYSTLIPSLLAALLVAREEKAVA